MTKEVLVIDNYDSFTFNLVHLIESLGDFKCCVVRNDRFPLELVEKFHKVLLSPGPGIPSESGLMPQVVRRFFKEKSIFGVCLGHQCIGEIFGGTLHNLSKPFHARGCKTVVVDSGEPLFKNVPGSFVAGRYHSWVVSEDNFPKDLIVTATDEDGRVMALRHREYDLRGVQFHPESVLTEHGSTMMSNWLAL